MMVGREGSLGWCLINGTALSSGAQVGMEMESSCCSCKVLVQRTRAVRMGYAGAGPGLGANLSGARAIPCHGHPNLCLSWSARSWILTSGHAKIVGPSSRDLVV